MARSATGSFSGDEEALERVRIKGEMMTGMILRKELRASKAKLMEYTYGRHYAVHRDLVEKQLSLYDKINVLFMINYLYIYF